MESVSEHGSPNIQMAIVGHKCDLEEDRSVRTDEGKKVSVVLVTYTVPPMHMYCTYHCYDRHYIIPVHVS